MKLLTIAALIVTATTLQACTHQEHVHSESIFTALGAPLPGALAEPEAVADASAAVAVEPEPVTPPPPPPPQYGEPGYVAAYMEKGYTGPEPCPGSVFRVLTCDDDGLSWHWLDSNMNWIQ